MLITYLIANYNNAAYISECINSLYQQTSPKWHALICDDASADNSLTVIEPLLNDSITLIRNRRNRGYVETLKILIENAQTDIVGILDPDDVLCPKATELVLKAYKAQTNCGFIHTDWHWFREDDIQQLYTKKHIGKPNGKTALIYGEISHLKTFKKSLYVQTDGLDKQTNIAADRDLIYLMEEVTDFYFIDEPLYKYRVHNKGISQYSLKDTLENHRLVRENTMRRRGIQGIYLWVHQLINFTVFTYPKFKFVGGTLMHLIRFFNLDIGKLKRATK